RFHCCPSRFAPAVNMSQYRLNAGTGSALSGTSNLSCRSSAFFQSTAYVIINPDHQTRRMLKMHHNTVADRARKARVRENEYRRLATRQRRLDTITDEQIGDLKKIKAAEAKEKPLNTTAVSDWRLLRDMGVVKEYDGALVLTTTGVQVVTAQDSK
ncbi:MAG: hypothetical protein ABI947_18885, partial [Chloroflexota bacterium]